MADPQTHIIKKIAHKDKPVLLNQLSAVLFYLLDLLKQQPVGSPIGLPVKKLSLKLRLIKRLSPFLLTALFLPLLFIHMLIAEDSVNKWMLCFLFVVTEVNLFYIDIVLWKYFGRKKLFFIWTIEMFLVLVTTYFIA